VVLSGRISGMWVYVVLSGRITGMGLTLFYSEGYRECDFVQKNAENGDLCGFFFRNESGKGVFIWVLLVSPRKCWGESLLQLLYPNSFSIMSHNHPRYCH
jgi:hypothetical protein